MNSPRATGARCMSNGPATWVSAQLDGFVHPEAQRTSQWSVSALPPAVLFRKSTYVTPTVPLELTSTVGSQASTPAGLLLMTMPGDHVTPPSPDCEYRTWPICGSEGTASSQTA